MNNIIEPLGEHDPRYHEPKFEYKRVQFKECAIAGIAHHLTPGDDLWQELCEGAELALVRDRNNRYDRNAVAVALADDYNGDPDDFDFDLILGYVPRNENEALARMLDAGFDEYITAAVTSFRTDGDINTRIRMSIFLESQKPTVIRPNLLRATTLEIEELRGLNDELQSCGTTYMRFGGFYDRMAIEPVQGEKIVAVYNDDPEQIVLYLLQVLATGSNCGKYLDDPEDLYMVDDCCPYILTNICGPVVVNRHASDCFDEMNLSDLDPMEYLNEEYSAHFNQIFDSVIRGVLNKQNQSHD